MKRFLYIILLTLLCASSVHGQDNDYSISGEILNDQKQPIPYCTIGVWQLSDSSLVTGGVSDEMGHFKIARLKDGRYEFRVSHLQYETTILPVVIDRNTELSVITLKPSVVALDEVTVIGTKPLLKVYPDKIVYNVLNSPDAKRANLQEVFEKLPLVTPSGSNYLIHGSIAPQYLINGKSSSMLAADPVKVLKSIPASTIKEIEVIANPGAKYDGDNSGGIINIITADKTAAPLSASISTTVNTRGATDANISISTQIDKVFVQGSYTHSEDPDYMKKTTSERINESSSDFYLLKQEGNKTKTHSHTNMFMLESSWTPDTLNVFNFSMNYLDYKTDTHNKELQRNTMYHIGGDETYFYLSKMKSHETYGNMDLSTDYQRKSGRNGTLLLMYKYTDMPKESDDYFLIEEARNYQNPSMHNWQKLHNKENTMQVDYSNNWSDQHYLNAGAKYIIRNNTNNSRYETMGKDGQWDYQYSSEDYFKHQQKVLSVYAEYMMQISRWSCKVGLRDELTKEKVSYEKDPALNFEVDFNNLLPFVTIAYNLKNGDSFSASYRNRIERPSIAYLNPKVFYTDPSSIYYGNPNIESEQHRTVALDYSRNKEKYTANLSADYSFCNNSIQSYYGINSNNLYYETYNNSASYKMGTLSGFLSYRPLNVLSISMNATAKYVSLKDIWQNQRLTNRGWTGSISSNIGIQLPKGYNASMNGAYIFRSIDLQGKYFNFYYCECRLSKSFLKDRLDLSLSGRDVFWKNKSFKSKYTSLVHMKTNVQIYGSVYELSVVYRFNSASISAKKTSKTIYNDDVKNK